jgi:tight adherence protein C
VIGRKFLIGVAGALLGGTASTSPPMGVALVILFGLAGWRLPDFALARQARAVRARSQAAIPELLDLVAVSVTAGLTPRLALDRAGAALSGPLAAELEEARRSVDLGQSWAEVLRRTAERLDLRDLRRLSSTLERSARLGAPVAERLRGLAREVRAERRAREEERARRAPVTMLFPLVFLILPAFVLAAVVPTILVATRGIR